MKKFTKKELKEYLRKEVEKTGIAEGWIANKLTITNEIKKLNKNTELTDNNIVKESEKIQLEDVKLLEEEVKRMKELIDFRSPLLKKD